MNNDFTTKNIQAYEIHILQTFKQALLMNPPENSASLIDELSEMITKLQTKEFPGINLEVVSYKFYMSMYDKYIFEKIILTRNQSHCWDTFVDFVNHQRMGERSLMSYWIGLPAF